MKFQQTNIKVYLSKTGKAILVKTSDSTFIIAKSLLEKMLRGEVTSVNLSKMIGEEKA